MKRLKDFKAIIFDMDGVLVDSEKIWDAHEVEYLKDFITPEKIKEKNIQTEIIGRSIFGIYDFLVETFPKEMGKISRDIFLKKYEIFGLEKIYSQTNLLPGVLDILNHLKLQNKPVALASSSPRIWIDAVLKRHDLEKFFPKIVSGCSVENGKPDPEIFLKVAQEINVNPQDCLVLEDSKNGVLAGKSAGMTVAGFKNGFNEDQDLSQADMIFDDFLIFLKDE